MADKNPKRPSFNSIDFRKYAKYLRKRESGGEINEYTLSKHNRFGYLGLYQMGVEALEDAGFLKKGTYKNEKEKKGRSNEDILRDNNNWTKNNSYENFISDEKTQTKAFRKFTESNYRYLSKNAKDKLGEGDELWGNLAAAHLGGVGNAMKLINNSDDFADGNGTKVSNYKNGYINFSKKNSLTNEQKIKAFKDYEFERINIIENNPKGSPEISKKLKYSREKFAKEYGSEILNEGRELSNYNNKVEWESNNPEYGEAKKAEEEAKEIQRKIDEGNLSEKELKNSKKKIISLNRKRNNLFGKIQGRDFDRIEKQNLESLKLEDVGTDAYNQKLKTYKESQLKNKNFQKELNSVNSEYNQLQRNVDSLKKIKTSRDKNYWNTLGRAQQKVKDFDFGYGLNIPNFRAEDYYENNIDEIDLPISNYNDSFAGDINENTSLNGAEGQGDVTDSKETSTDETKETASTKNEDDIMFGTPFDVTQEPAMYSEDTQEQGSAKDFLKNNPLAPLTALTGLVSAIDSKKSVEVPGMDDTTKLSDAFYEHLNNLETISKRGFTPEEEANFLRKANDGYNASMENAVRASGGNRAQVLNVSGALNANKNKNLLNFASNDAEMHRRNLDNYGKALQYKEQFQERKDIRQQTYDLQEKNLKFQQELESRQGSAMLAASSIGSILKDVKEYKQVGKGSQFDRFLKLRNKNLENDMMAVNPFTNKFYASSEEYEDVLKKKDFMNNFQNQRKANGVTKEEADMYNSLNSSDKYNYAKENYKNS